MVATTTRRPRKLFDTTADRYIEKAASIYNDGHMEKIVGIGLNMPFENTNSAARKLMYASQYQQHVCLVKPEIPIISTGYENKFGSISSSIEEAKCDFKVLAKVPKYSWDPDNHYWLFLINEEQGILDVIEKVDYHYNTETYGYKYDNSYLDALEVGSFIGAGDIMKKSDSFDEYNNFTSGVNLRVAYMSDSNSTEDAIEMSRTAARKLARIETKTVSITINDNSIPLNLYGNNEEYKVMPDIGERVQNGILCGIRTENRDECFYTQANERLSRLMINDDPIIPKNGTVVDIDVMCNNSDFDNNPNIMYEGQIQKYLNERKRMYQEFIDAIAPYDENRHFTKTYRLTELLCTSKMVLEGRQFIKDDKIFSNIVIDVTILEEACLEEGDKVTSRYGGKGVVSRIIDDDKMPRIHGTDIPVDMIWNQATCINRENLGQLFEVSLNFISSQVVREMYENCGPNRTLGDDIMDMFNFYNEVSPEWAQFFIDELDKTYLDEDMTLKLDDFIDHEHGCLYIPLKPISESMTLKKLMKIYENHPKIAPVYLDVPMEYSRGKGFRFVKSDKPCVPAMQYIYRMKQNAEEKHSATGMSAINIRNENAKSKASKTFIRAHASTPIRWGEMESYILLTANPEAHVVNLMLLSTSPEGRRCCSQLLTNDPYNIDVKLDIESKSRSAETLKAILKTMGLRLKFSKIKIKYDDPNNSSFFKYVKPSDRNLFAMFKPSDPNLFKYFEIREDNLFGFRSPNDSNLFKYAPPEEDNLFKRVNPKDKKIRSAVIIPDSCMDKLSERKDE